MRCANPYVKKIGYIDPRYVEFPCGRCLPCRINYTRQWTQRLIAEQQHSDSAYFVTLTYNDESLPRDDNDNPCVCKEDIQKFFKRLRKAYPDAGIRYFLGSEYGDLGRPHYHAIIYNLPDHVLEASRNGGDQWRFHDGEYHMANRRIQDIWSFGFVEIDPMTRGRAEYCSKYFVFRKDVDEIRVPNFNVMSRRPGIGRAKVEEIKDKVRYYDLHGMLTDLGTYTAIPRFYRKHIYTEEERSAKYLDFVEKNNTPEARKKYLEQEASRVSGEEYEKNVRRSITFKGKKRKDL